MAMSPSNISLTTVPELECVCVCVTVFTYTDQTNIYNQQWDFVVWIFYCYVHALWCFSLSLGILFQAFTYVLIHYFRNQAEGFRHISAAI
jgi:hypothetical protein